jgi:hypothetical protein
LNRRISSPIGFVLIVIFSAGFFSRSLSGSELQNCGRTFIPRSFLGSPRTPVNPRPVTSSAAPAVAPRTPVQKPSDPRFSGTNTQPDPSKKTLASASTSPPPPPAPPPPPKSGGSDSAGGGRGSGGGSGGSGGGGKKTDPLAGYKALLDSMIDFGNTKSGEPALRARLDHPEKDRFLDNDLRGLDARIATQREFTAFRVAQITARRVLRGEITWEAVLAARARKRQAEEAAAAAAPRPSGDVTAAKAADPRLSSGAKADKYQPYRELLDAMLPLITIRDHWERFTTLRRHLENPEAHPNVETEIRQVLSDIFGNRLYRRFQHRATDAMDSFARREAQEKADLRGTGIVTFPDPRTGKPVQIEAPEGLANIDLDDFLERTGYQPRDYQRAWADALDVSVGAGENRGFIRAPTQMGKTMSLGPMAVAMTLRHFTGKAILVISPYLALTDTIVGDLYGSGLRIGRIDGDHKDFTGDFDLVLASAHTLGRPEHIDKLPVDRFGFVVFDELLFAYTPTGQRLLKRLGFIDEAGKIQKVSGKYLLGLLSDPYDVTPLMGRGARLDTYNLSWYIQKGYSHKPVGIRGRFRKDKLLWEKIRDRAEVLVSPQDSDDFADAVYGEYKNHGQGKRRGKLKALINVASIAHARRLEAYFNEREGAGFAYANHSERNSTDNSRAEADYAGGTSLPRVMISIGRLAQSWRGRGTELILNTYLTASLRRYGQRIGRALGVDIGESQRTILVVDMDGDQTFVSGPITLPMLFGLPGYQGDGIPYDPIRKMKEIRESFRGKNPRPLLKAVATPVGFWRFEYIDEGVPVSKLIFPTRFPRLLNEVLAQKFKGNAAALAEAIDIDEVELNRYTFGDLPLEAQVVVRIETGLGIPQNLLVQAWELDALEVIGGLYPLPKSYGPATVNLVAAVRRVALYAGRGSVRSSLSETQSRSERYAEDLFRAVVYGRVFGGQNNTISSTRLAMLEVFLTGSGSPLSGAEGRRLIDGFIQEIGRQNVKGEASRELGIDAMDDPQLLVAIDEEGLALDNATPWEPELEDLGEAIIPNWRTTPREEGPFALGDQTRFDEDLHDAWTREDVESQVAAAEEAARASEMVRFGLMGVRDLSSGEIGERGIQEFYEIDGAKGLSNREQAAQMGVGLTTVTNRRKRGETILAAPPFGNLLREAYSVSGERSGSKALPLDFRIWPEGISASKLVIRFDVWKKLQMEQDELMALPILNRLEASPATVLPTSTKKLARNRAVAWMRNRRAGTTEPLKTIDLILPHEETNEPTAYSAFTKIVFDEPRDVLTVLEQERFSPLFAWISRQLSLNIEKAEREATERQMSINIYDTNLTRRLYFFFIHLSALRLPQFTSVHSMAEFIQEELLTILEPGYGDDTSGGSDFHALVYQPQRLNATEEQVLLDIIVELDAIEAKLSEGLSHIYNLLTDYPIMLDREYVAMMQDLSQESGVNELVLKQAALRYRRQLGYHQEVLVEPTAETVTGKAGLQDQNYVVSYNLRFWRAAREAVIARTLPTDQSGIQRIWQQVNGGGEVTDYEAGDLARFLRFLDAKGPPRESLYLTNP